MLVTNNQGEGEKVSSLRCHNSLATKIALIPW